jgi:hypothetical protein
MLTACALALVILPDRELLSAASASIRHELRAIAARLQHPARPRRRASGGLPMLDSQTHRGHVYISAMSAEQVFFTICTLAIGLAGLVMALASTRPKEAASALWEWLKTAQKWALLASLLVLFAGGIIWHLYPTEEPIPVAGEEVYGELKPADDPTPSNACDQLNDRLLAMGKKFNVPDMPKISSADLFKVIIGDNAIGTSAFGKYPVLTVGTCNAISLERTENGLLFNAILRDDDDNEVIQIENNRIKALKGGNYSARQSIDRATITVSNKSGKVLFYVRFLNPMAVRLRGFFGCGSGNTISVEDDKPFTEMSWNCLIGGGGGIRIG